MGNIVKLVFQTFAQGSGLSTTLQKVKELSGAMPGLSKGVQILSGMFGTAGMAAGRFASMLLQGGVWGAAAEGIKFVIDQLGIFKDKSEKAKKELDELKTETEKFYSTITDNYEKAKGKLDKETEVRKAQLEITNRMIKAEMELRRAKALSSGDVGTANAIEDEMSNIDAKSAVDKSEADVSNAEQKVKAAEERLKIIQKKAHDADDEINRAQKALEVASKPLVMQSSAGAYVHQRDTTAEKETLSAAVKKADAVEDELEAASAAVAEERRKLQLARQNLEVLKKEQEAAKAKAKAEKDAAEAKQKANAKKAKEDADKKFLEEAKAQQVKYENEERDRKKRQAKEEAEEKKRKLREFEAEKIREEMRTNRATAANYEQTLSDAIQRVADKRDILKNAADMDQAGDIESENQAKHVEERYAKRREALQKRLDRVGGDASKLGRLSNIDKAVLDRMGTEKVKDSATEELKELNKKFEKLSQRLEAATQL